MDEIQTILEDLINITSFRHRVLSSNIANIDTPHYRAKDVHFGKVLHNEMIELVATSDNHISISSGKGLVKGRVREEPILQWEDENTVELDMEVAKMTENALLYEGSIKLLSARMRMFRNAMRGK